MLVAPHTVQNWALRAAGRQLLWNSGVRCRLRMCAVRIVPKQRGVTVFARPDRPYGRVGNVCVCGQSLLCPVCAPRIAAFRGAEVSLCFKRVTAAGQARRTLLSAQLAKSEDAYLVAAEAATTAEKFKFAPKAAGQWEAWLVTYTSPHSAGTNLTEELDVFRDAWMVFQSGKGSTRLRGERVLGSHVAREVTYGENGWHYHHHVCQYVRPGYDFEFVRRRWLSALRSVGRYRAEAEHHAFDASQIFDPQGARYVAKIAGAVDAVERATCDKLAMELAGGVFKTERGPRVGRNLITLLHDATFAGDWFARQKWLEACRAITCRKISSVRWSPGLRGLVGIAAGAKSDEQIAKEEVTRADVLLGALRYDQWLTVCAAHAELALCIAANQGRAQVNTLLANISAGELHDDPAEVDAL